MDLRDPQTGQVYFTHAELACKATGRVVLGFGFANALVALRRDFGRPMRVTSCCRSREHNDTVGGHYRSLHVYDDTYHQTGGTVAVDVAFSDQLYLYDLVRLAVSTGWSFGINWPKRFIHLDRRGDFGLPSAVFPY